jgi:hypothetical protein
MSGSNLPIPAYLSISANESTRIKQFESTDPQTKADIAYITKQAPTLTTPDALMKDYRSLSIVLNAFGLSDRIGQTALLKQVMTQDPTSKTSTAYKLGDAALTRFATAMAQFKTSPFSTSTNVDAVITSMSTNNYEAAQDTLSPGIGYALYFKRSIASLTTIQQVMADPKLLKVATTATNMPDQFGTLDYNQQVSLLSSKIKMSDFSNPAYVDKFVGKYLAINAANNSTVSDPSGALAILTGSGSSTDIMGALFPANSSSSGDSGILSLFA